MTTPQERRSGRIRATDLLSAAFRAVSNGGPFTVADQLNVAAAVDVLVDAAREEQPPQDGGEVVSTTQTFSIGRLLDLARILNETAQSQNGGYLNPAYLDGLLRLISEAAGAEPMRAQVSVEPTAEFLRKGGLTDDRVSVRRLIDLSRSLFLTSRNPVYRSGIVALICAALGQPVDQYGAAVETAITDGLPWHGYLRPPVLQRPPLKAYTKETPNVGLPPIRKLISYAREIQSGECDDWAAGQAALICKILGLDSGVFASRILGLITEPEESAHCKHCRKVITRRGAFWQDAGYLILCPARKSGREAGGPVTGSPHDPDDNAI